MIHALALVLLGSPAQTGQPARQLAVLQHLYVQHCARCHGPDGSATDPDGNRLKGLDFTSDQEMKGRSDAEMAKSISKGLLFGLKMPAFNEVFNEAEIHSLIQDILRKTQKGKPIGEQTNASQAR